jgi:hypothetical protein
MTRVFKGTGDETVRQVVASISVFVRGGEG